MRAIAARRARHVLADAVRRPAGVLHLFHVAAQMVDQRETEHRAVGAGDEERLRCGARRDHARRGRRRQPGRARLRGARESRAQVHAARFELLVVIVAGRRIGRHAAGVAARVENVGRQHRIERQVVAHHADHGGGVVVERSEHRLFAIGPRRHQVLERDVVERAAVHGDARRAGRVSRQQGGHLIEHARARCDTGDALVDALGLLARAGAGEPRCAQRTAQQCRAQCAPERRTRVAP